MENNKQSDIPEREYLVIPVPDRNNKAALYKWHDEFQPRVKAYWVGKKLRYKNDGSVKTIVDVDFEPNSFPVPDCYLTVFIFDDRTRIYGLTHFHYDYELFEVI